MDLEAHAELKEKELKNLVSTMCGNNFDLNQPLKLNDEEIISLNKKLKTFGNENKHKNQINLNKEEAKLNDEEIMTLNKKLKAFGAMKNEFDQKTKKIEENAKQEIQSIQNKYKNYETLIQTLLFDAEENDCIQTE